MSLGSLSLSLTVLWLAIHALNSLIRAHKHHASLLPTTAAPRLRTSSPAWHITLKHIHLRIQTTACNSAHDRLATRLASKRWARVRKALRGFYDVGSGVGALGMIVGVGVLVWTLGELGLGLVRGFGTQERQAEVVAGVVKRALESTRVVQTGARTTSLLNPIIPGVTVPLTHLPLIFLSVFICQIIHEAGHALSAALEQIPLLATGLSLTLILPSAFVTFPTPNANSVSFVLPSSEEALQNKSRQRASSRMKVVAGGAWHNLAFWGILALIARGSREWMWGLMGYENVSKLGRVVLGFDADSPLRDHLPLGALITQLDDVSLGASWSGAGPGQDDVWTSYLTGKYHPTNKGEEEGGVVGWCVGSVWWMDKPTTCCDHAPNTSTEDNASSPQLACFSSIRTAHGHGQSTAGCLDPIPLLTNPYPNPNGVDSSESDGSQTQQSQLHAPTQTHKRCSASNPCPADNECVRLREGERILRVTFKGGEDGREVLLWSGPNVEVWEQVEVGTLRPRWWFLPLRLPSIVRVFFEYLQMATLSLYLFNLLPLPLLDGTQLLDAVLDFIFDSPTYTREEDVEQGVSLGALEGGRMGRGININGRGRRRGLGRGRWKHWVGRMVQSGTVGLSVGCVGLGVIDWMVAR